MLELERYKSNPPTICWNNLEMKGPTQVQEKEHFLSGSLSDLRIYNSPSQRLSISSWNLPAQLQARGHIKLSSEVSLPAW